jgi:RNA polymerase primary sigma factor
MVDSTGYSGIHRAHGRTVRVPLNRTADLSRIIKTAENLRQERSREPTPEEIAQVTGLSIDVVQALAALNTADVRLDAPLDPDGDRTLVDRFVSDQFASSEDTVMDHFLSEEIGAALRTLPHATRGCSGSTSGSTVARSILWRKSEACSV